MQIYIPILSHYLGPIFHDAALARFEARLALDAGDFAHAAGTALAVSPPAAHGSTEIARLRRGRPQPAGGRARHQSSFYGPISVRQGGGWGCRGLEHLVWMAVHSAYACRALAGLAQQGVPGAVLAMSQVRAERHSMSKTRQEEEQRRLKEEIKRSRFMI